MIKLTTKAENYAAEKTNELMTKAIAQAYADGYRDGYKDREEEIPVDFRDNKTEYVDLGLPSGTLWSANFEREGDEFLYEPYVNINGLNIPTNEQCLELYKCCAFKPNGGSIICIGPNGNCMSFSKTGYREIGKESKVEAANISFFWIIEDEKWGNVAAAAIGDGFRDTRQLFKGYKLPIRLVRTK